ncbi:uncharacterized protein LOC135160017 [Diachasmimorpha longicaudata]|uniref:uncharacterized protein LOC135160017 n=1 Tax=Diachasmimorpha longicaudata TaxID=58733 RepID=UPI0030B8CEE3
MIIVFFHVLYLLGKFIYRSYGEDDSLENDGGQKRDKVLEDAAGDDDDQYLREPKKKLDLYDDFYGKTEVERIRFSPPAYLQRYHAVASLLGSEKFEGQIRKVVDFGCSEFGFFRHLKNTRGIEEILCVDVDRNSLEVYKARLEPLTADYLSCRNTPLTVHVLEGSVTDNDQYLENTDAVICIELIEHLYPETCLNLPFNIFGFIQPKVAVFTTPNADFNVLFKGMNGFRHWDHKFEWSRQQFHDWAENIITRYPNYEVEFTGIGAGPPGTEPYGQCSQMATFTRKLDRTFSPGIPGLFKLVATVEYPYQVDNRPIEERTLEEAKYYIRRYSGSNEDVSMPLQLLAQWINTISVKTLRNILEEGGMQIVDDRESGLSVVCPPLSEYSGYDYKGDNYDNNAYEFLWDEQPGLYQQQDQQLSHENQEMWHFEEKNDPSEANNLDNFNNGDLYLESVRNMGNCEIPQNSGALNFKNSGCEFQPAVFFNNSIPSTSKNVRRESAMPADLLNLRNTQRCPKKKFNDLAPVSGKRTNSLGGKMDGENQDSCDFEVASSSSTEQLLCEEGCDSLTLGSICSMYLQSSTCTNEDTCLENTTNPDFHWSSDVSISDGSCNEKIPQYSSSTNDSPNSTSTPVKSQRKSQQDNKLSHSSPLSNKCHGFEDNHVGQNELSPGERSLEKYSASPDSCSSCEKEKSEVMRKLKKGGLMKNSKNHRLSLDGEKNSLNGGDTSPTNHARDFTFDIDRCRNNHSPPIITKRPLSLSTSDQLSQHVEDRHVDRKEMKNFELDEADDKVSLSEARGSTPNSWSPEFCLDSGYPNTSSVHDITPEFDLSSIGQDTISESQSPSFAEPPRQLEALVGVENGDLVNNNRDGEGNNVIPMEEHQPGEEREEVDENENIDA